MTIKITTDVKRQVIDITERVQQELQGSGLVNIFVLHTTAAITTADLDPDTDQDYLDALQAMTPDKKWHHPHDPSHFPDHLWASVIGPSLVVPYKNGKLQLGTWQRVILIEMDGPRERQVELTFTQN
jgi:secondary thiamine-phosphate synthase enzyme